MNALDYEDQALAFEFIESHNGPVFITGPAGTGKSRLLEHLRDYGKHKENTLVAAFTGAAAVNVSGVTLHSLYLHSNLGRIKINVWAPMSDQRELRVKNIEVLSSVDLFIIDEVSMVRADLLDALDRALRQAKKTNAPFGGVRLVMFGDIYQLPPFVNNNIFTREADFLSSYEDEVSSYFFLAHVLQQMDLAIYNLWIPKRQGKDEVFYTNLNLIRNPDTAYKAFDYFNTRLVNEPELDAGPRLYAQRKPAREHNNQRILALEGEAFTHQAYFTDLDGNRTEPQDGSDQQAPEELTVKIGAYVMILKNLDVNAGLVNGATARVLSYDREKPSITVQLTSNGLVHELAPERFDLLGYKLDETQNGETKKKYVRSLIVGYYVQFPIALAWGVTIHKAQGATLPTVSVDFRHPFPQPGQAYVALSRVREITDLHLLAPITDSHISDFPLHHWIFGNQIPEKGLKLESRLPKAEAFALCGEVLEKYSLEEIFEFLDLHIDGLPSIQDIFEFSYKKRLKYLRDFVGILPSEALITLVRKKPLIGLSVLANIERIIRRRRLLDWETLEPYSDEPIVARIKMASEALDSKIAWHDSPRRHDLDVVARGAKPPTAMYWRDKNDLFTVLFRDKYDWRMFTGVDGRPSLSELRTKKPHAKSFTGFFNLLWLNRTFDSSPTRVYFEGDLTNAECENWVDMAFGQIGEVEIVNLHSDDNSDSFVDLEKMPRSEANSQDWEN